MIDPETAAKVRELVEDLLYETRAAVDELVGSNLTLDYRARLDAILGEQAPLLEIRVGMCWCGGIDEYAGQLVKQHECSKPEPMTEGEGIARLVSAPVPQPPED